jgi:hypothetical protein
MISVLELGYDGRVIAFLEQFQSFLEVADRCLINPASCGEKPTLFVFQGRQSNWRIKQEYRHGKQRTGKA